MHDHHESDRESVSVVASVAQGLVAMLALGALVWAVTGNVGPAIDHSIEQLGTAPSFDFQPRP